MTDPITYDSEDAVHAAVSRLTAEGWRVFVLPVGIRTKSDFFDATVETFPLDPPLMRARDVWDALYDSLGAGLLDVDVRRIAVAWPDAYLLAETDPNSYEIAKEILASHVPETLAHGEWTNDGYPKQFVAMIGVRS